MIKEEKDYFGSQEK